MAQSELSDAELAQHYSLWESRMWEETFGSERSSTFLDNVPSDVRVAVLLTFDTQGDVDAAVSPEKSATQRTKNGQINFCDLTQRQYGTRRGVQRILTILAKHDIKATFPTCGVTAEWYPELIREIAAAGHEVAAHGYRHTQLFELSPDQEADEIAKTTAAIEHVIGERPVGWRSPKYSTTTSTIRLLTEQGYIYNTDFHNDDLPYILDNESGSILEIPAGLDDWVLYLTKSQDGVYMGGTPYGVPSNVGDILRAEFEMLYEEGATEPRIMQYCMHPKITGRPYRAWGLDQFITYVESRPGVRFYTMRELADMSFQG